MSGDVQIAYQVYGDGAVNVVFASLFVSNIKLFWPISMISGRWRVRSRG